MIELIILVLVSLVEGVFSGLGQNASSFLLGSCPCGTLVVTAMVILTSGALVYYLTSPKQPGYRLDYSVFDVNKYSKILPGPERIHVSSWGAPLEYKVGGAEFPVKTLYENFVRGRDVSGSGPCLGWRPAPGRPFTWLSYSEVLRRAHAAGAGLLNLGLNRGHDSFIGIYAQNCPEWVITSLGSMAYSIGVVPLYDSLGASSCTFIINQAEISIIVCDSAGKALSLIGSKQETPSLKHIIVIRGDQVDQDLLDRASAADIQIHKFTELMRLGEQHPHELTAAGADDLFMICYTSGTTGTPKGVMLSHSNVLRIVESLCGLVDLGGFTLGPDDVLLSYLPLAHMFEQLSHAICFYYGAKIAFSSGDVRKLPDDLKEAQPTFIPVVPRILNRLYDKVQSTIRKSKFKKALFKHAYESKLAEQMQGIYRSDGIWDRLIFNKIRAEFGGNLRYMVTASAPVSGEVLNFARVALGCPILEGYGQTESTAGVVATAFGDFNGDHVGGPFPCAHFKLGNAPELNYFAKDDVGEIMIRGPTLMKGYFKDPEKTAETIDADGWLHTGDIGRWLPNGALKIIDRKKHIFKLAQGEYVAPEKIENVYVRCPILSQIYVDGNSIERYLVAIVVPEDHELLKFLSKNGIDTTNELVGMDDLVQQPNVKQLMLNAIKKVGKENKLSSLEQINAIHITTERFSVENGLLTPTLKNKRPALRQKYAKIIDQLYIDTNAAQ